jgi:hypothetical protein
MHLEEAESDRDDCAKAGDMQDQVLDTAACASGSAIEKFLWESVNNPRDQGLDTSRSGIQW